MCGGNICLEQSTVAHWGNNLLHRMGGLIHYNEVGGGHRGQQYRFNCYCFIAGIDCRAEDINEWSQGREGLVWACCNIIILDDR